MLMMIDPDEALVVWNLRVPPNGYLSQIVWIRMAVYTRLSMYPHPVCGIIVLFLPTVMTAVAPLPRFIKSAGGTQLVSLLIIKYWPHYIDNLFYNHRERMAIAFTTRLL